MSPLNKFRAASATVDSGQLLATYSWQTSNIHCLCLYVHCPVMPEAGPATTQTPRTLDIPHVK